MVVGIIGSPSFHGQFPALRLGKLGFMDRCFTGRVPFRVSMFKVRERSKHHGVLALGLKRVGWHVTPLSSSCDVACTCLTSYLLRILCAAASRRAAFILTHDYGPVLCFDHPDSQQYSAEGLDCAECHS